MKDSTLKYHTIQTSAVMQATVMKTFPSAIDLFEESISSPVTREDYKRDLRRFTRATSFIFGEQHTDAKVLQAKLLAYIVQLKHQGISYGRRNAIISAVKKYCEVYEVEGVKFTKIYAVMGEKTRKYKDRGYSIEELRTMLEAANVRVKALMLLFASTGIREGAVPVLFLKHLTKLEDGRYKVSVYDESEKFNYYAFTTLESAKALDTYFMDRELEGEQIWLRDENDRIIGWVNPEAPLIRKEFSWRSVNALEPLSGNSLRRMIEDVAVRTGIRKPLRRKALLLEITRLKAEGKDTTALEKQYQIKRHPVKCVHGIRKFYSTKIGEANLNNSIQSVLMGWSEGTRGLRGIYQTFSEKRIYEEYLKAENWLTISQEKELQAEVERLRTERADIEILKAKLIEQERRIAMIKSEVTNGLPDDPQTTPLKSRVQMMTVAATYKGRKLTKEQYYALVEAAKVLEELKPQSISDQKG